MSWESLKGGRTGVALQGLLASAVMLGILVMLDPLTDLATIASLGASSFIAFAMPRARASQPRLLLGGYLVGIVVGWACYSLSTVLPSLALLPIVRSSQVLFGAAAVGLSTIIMVLTDTEHPPAAGLALGLVLSGWDLTTLAVIAVAVVSLVVLHKLLSPVVCELPCVTDKELACQE
jgi:CBS-domain-containing membrane protein